MSIGYHRRAFGSDLGRDDLRNNWLWPSYYTQILKSPKRKI